jgi:hypothetical protein
VQHRLLRALIAPSALALAAALTASVSAAAEAHRIQPTTKVSMAGVHCHAGLLLHHHKKVYAAVPASCGALPNDEGKEQDGCVAAGAPIGTPVKVHGAKHKATLVYDSFSTMQLRSDRNHHECYYNDLALLQLSKADAKAARGNIPGLHAPKRVSSRGPADGSQVGFGTTAATAGPTAKGGWVYTLSASPAMTADDVGTPVTQGGRLFGMLVVIPQGMVTKTSAEVYNLHRALRMARHTKGFHHLKLLRAGSR